MGGGNSAILLFCRLDSYKMPFECFFPAVIDVLDFITIFEKHHVATGRQGISSCK